MIEKIPFLRYSKAYCGIGECNRFVQERSDWIQNAVQRGTPSRGRTSVRKEIIV
jgi:hypothetical protein